MEVKTKSIQAKSVSDVTTTATATSIDLSSPRRPPLYYVQSPPQHDHHDAEKMLDSSLPYSPPLPDRHSHSFSVQQSRDSSISRFSVSSLVNRQDRNDFYGHAKKIDRFDGAFNEIDEDFENSGRGCSSLRLCFCSFFWFVVLLSVFSISLWGASKGFKPIVRVQHIVFHSFIIHKGVDKTGVSTDLISLNATVKIFYENPATYFGVHVTSTPVQLSYYELKVASGHIEEFYRPRKSKLDVITTVSGKQVPLYGALIVPRGSSNQLENVQVPLNLTFIMRSRAHILGHLVKSKFYSSIICSIRLRGSNLGKVQNLANSCSRH